MPDIEFLTDSFAAGLLQRARHMSQAADEALYVPAISRFFGITITMYFDDHAPPHFHARASDGEARIEIDPLRVLASTLDHRGLALVIEWANQHQNELLDNWQRARRHETLKPIEPLQ